MTCTKKVFIDTEYTLQTIISRPTFGRGKMHLPPKLEAPEEYFMARTGKSVDPLTHKPGELVHHSGIYSVTHEDEHFEKHEVTCVEGKRFPPCSGCKHPRFLLARAAQHVEAHPLFIRAEPSPR